MRRGSLWALAIAISLTIVANGKSAHAAPDVAQGLQISPVLVEFNTDRGQIYTLKVSVLNVTTGDLVFSGHVNDFQAKDESGTPQILLDHNLPDASSLVKWIEPIGSISLKSKQTKELQVKITVPPDAEPGGHYGVVRFSGTAPELHETSVSLAASVGTLLLVRVNGKTNENLVMKDFFTQRGGHRSVWFETGPVTFVERITNSGNVHVKPIGDIVITNMLGHSAGTIHINDTKGNILPNSTRRFEEIWNKKWLFGRYTASASLAYGTHGQVLQATTSFWVIPYKVIIVILILVALLILLIQFFVKRYNAKIIKKALDEKNQNHPSQS